MYVDQVQLEFRNLAAPPTPVRLQVERASAELISVCVENASSATAYILEESVTLDHPDDPGSWAEVKAIDPSFCELLYSSLKEARFFCVRSAAP